MTTVRFASPTAFSSTLKRRVDAVMFQRQLPKHGGWRALAKAAFILTLLAASYAALVFWASNAWQVALCAGLVSQALVLTGFNIMHDAAHGALSKHVWINRALARSLDLIGGNSDLWRVKHHVLHHTYTNLDALDDDIDVGRLMRLHPSQRWRPWHRYQVLYAFPLYSLLSLHWFFADFIEFFSGRIGHRRHKLRNTGRTLLFLSFKLSFVVLGLGLPLLLHPVGSVLLIFFAIQLVVGFSISLVFQLAHVVDIVEMPTPAAPRLAEEWVLHQLRTTANFSPGSRFVSWYCGGLNRQVQHHLFSTISHEHYKHLEPAVVQTCQEFGVTVRSYPSLFAAIRGHVRKLTELSHPAVEP